MTTSAACANIKFRSNLDPFEFQPYRLPLMRGNVNELSVTFSFEAMRKANDVAWIP